MTVERPEVLFVCVHNAGRSQMAAHFFRHLADPAKATAISAGTQPAVRVNPVVVAAMAEVGLDVSGAVPQRLTPALCDGADRLFTMGCGDECPHVPGLRIDDWPLPDPRGKELAAVRAIRDEVRARVAALVAAEGWSR